MQFGAMNDPHTSVVEQAVVFADMGFDYIDLSVEEPCAGPHNPNWSQVKERLDALGLGVIVHTGPYLPIESPSSRVRAAAYAELRTSVDVAAFMGSPYCTMHFRAWSDQQPFEAGVSMYEQELGDLVAYGLSKGVQVAMENGPNNQGQLKAIRSILRNIPELKLLYDIGHGNVHTAKSLTETYLFDLGDRLVHVHLSDNDGTDDDHLPPGTPRKGGLNIKKEIQTLQKFNYDQTLTLEIFGQRWWLKETLRYMRHLMSQL